MAEVALALFDGAGVCVFRGAFPDTNVLDAVSQVFDDIIDYQHRVAGRAGDHFAVPGTNDRVWGALDKLCFTDPDLFAEYYSNVTIAGCHGHSWGLLIRSPPRSTLSVLAALRSVLTATTTWVS
jgi:ectoine hydroxylase-related dioxygenase (phytanoyl-CoA dioxygenase family)